MTQRQTGTVPENGSGGRGDTDSQKVTVARENREVDRKGPRATQIDR